jgi:hypothetical protein
MVEDLVGLTYAQVPALAITIDTVEKSLSCTRNACHNRSDNVRFLVADSYVFTMQAA